MATNYRKINLKHCTNKIRVDYAHAGLFDVKERTLWIAKKRIGVVPIRVSHARLLAEGGADSSTADKDRFVCYWCHTPGSGSGFVHGYPIEWNEGHVMVRLDPNWDYVKRKFVPSTDTVKIDRNIEQQYAWGQKIFGSYVSLKPKYAISWHMIGPRAADSMFYIQRVEVDRD